jgi:hypothetical protein
MSSTLLKLYNFYINSSQRNEGTPADFNMFLQTPLYLNGIIPSEFRFTIRYIQVPFCFSQFNQFNSTTKYTLLRNGITYSNGTFDLTTGNYNVNTFITEWIRALKVSLTSLASYTPLITGTYSADTNLITFTCPADSFGDTVITFSNNSGFTSVNLALGFTSSWTLSQNSTTTSAIDTNISPSRNLYLTSDTLIQSKSFDALTSPMSNSPALAVVPITVVPNQYITMYYNPPIVSILNNTVIDKFNFQLKDESLPFDLVDFFLNYTIYFTIEEHRTNEALNNDSLNLKVNQDAIRPTLAPPQEIPPEIMERRERLIQARGKLSKQLLEIKNALENDKSIVAEEI